MTQRQGRRSLGLAPLPGLPSKTDNGLTDLQKHEDFRRRHSKQNREIILDNAQRKSTIKELQDDIALLQIELLEVRQANLILQAKIKKIHKDNSNKMNGSKQIYDALNSLISVFPALEQLRDNLSSTSIIQEEDECEIRKKKYSLNGGIVENTYATRPAELARQNHGLWSLVEQSENGSGCEGETVLDRDAVRIDRRKSRSHNTPLGSVATTRSPRRSHQSPKISYVEIASPSSSRSSVSPSPKKRSSSSSSTLSSTKKQRKRRESGLIRPPPRSPSPGSRIPLEVNEDVGESSGRDESEDVEAQPSDPLHGQDIPMPNDIPPPSTTLSNSTHTRELELMDTIKEVSTSDGGSGSSSSRQQPPPSSSIEGMSHEEGGIGRGRRSRSSVNYKEPSLAKKMRKPDGMTTEEVLPILSSTKPNSRRSLASSSRPLTPPKNNEQNISSTSPESPLSPLPTNFDSILNESITNNTVKPIKNSTKQNGMRRKSTLPKPTNNKKIIDRQNEDEDDVDDLVELDLEYQDELENVQNRTKNLLLNSPLKNKGNQSPIKRLPKENSNSNDNLFNDNNLPKPPKSINNKSSFKPTPSSSSKVTSNLGIGRPIMPSTNLNNKITGGTTRNFTPTGRVISTKKVEEILQEGDGINIPSTTSTQIRKISDKQKNSTTVTATRRRMSAAV